ncbi:hypothetical protein [Ideonella paludis]|uniref:Uncharacterized protein n=1 Tax=Ideonella paludis TaxID=1233411 RepID=A0ABS5E445_9BURK|nr:hypothetical protein [Ideonella paludis]MBQ0937806.1 hypothetical protein [Ideonella paludis]
MAVKLNEAIEQGDTCMQLHHLALKGRDRHTLSQPFEAANIGLYTATVVGAALQLPWSTIVLEGPSGQFVASCSSCPRLLKLGIAPMCNDDQAELDRTVPLGPHPPAVGSRKLLHDLIQGRRHGSFGLCDGLSCCPFVVIYR